jgi:hypothetical protein
MSDATVAVVVPAPTPILKGKFAIFMLPDGGMKVAYKLDGSDDNEVITVPAFAMAMAAKMGGANPLAGLMGK